jgi:hypothetical protein
MFFFYSASKTVPRVWCFGMPVRFYLSVHFSVIALKGIGLAIFVSNSSVLPFFSCIFTEHMEIDCWIFGKKSTKTYDTKLSFGCLHESLSIMFVPAKISRLCHRCLQIVHPVTVMLFY